MWETLRNAWKVEELRKKLIYTFLMLVLFRLVGVIPVSGINAAVVKEVAGNYDMLGLVNMMTGNSFSQMTIMAMGITPYINSSIIMQSADRCHPRPGASSEGRRRGRQAEDQPHHPLCYRCAGCPAGHRHHRRPAEVRQRALSCVPELLRLYDHRRHHGWRHCPGDVDR